MALPEMKKNRIELTLRQYVDNPYKGSAFLASRKAIKMGLNTTFIKLLQKYRSQFYAIPYVYPDNSLLFHVMVPSEDFNVNRLYYDVLFKFENDPMQRYSLRKVKMFSNSPSFLYTYAYVYFNSGLIIDEFASKLPQIALTKQPSIRNPLESLGYEKSTYIAARYLIDGFILNDGYIKRFGKKMNALEEKNLFIKLGDPEKIVQIYALGREMMAKERRKVKNAERTEYRQKLRKEFINKTNVNKPKPSGFLIKKLPRGKINAKMAKKKYLT
jgi:hypothetical protein